MLVLLVVIEIWNQSGHLTLGRAGILRVSSVEFRRQGFETLRRFRIDGNLRVLSSA